MRHLLIASLTATLAGFAAGAEEAASDAPAPLTAEKAVIAGIEKPVTVTAKKELTIPTPGVADLAKTELYFRPYDGKAWGAWQKHGIEFKADQPLIWTPAEGVWQVYLRPTLTSGFAEPVPVTDPPRKEFSLIRVIDRTAPTAAIEFPAPNEKLRGGDKYTIKWQAADPYLRSAPVTLLWSRDGSKWEVIAANIANKGSYDWTVPVDMTKSGQLRIEVTDKADNVGSAVNSGILVDSVKPTGHVTGPAITNQLMTALALDIRDGGPAGLRSAQIWVSQDDGTSWTEGPWIKDPKQVGWTAPSDGRYRLYVLAIDNAGNSSPAPKGKSDDQFVIAVDTTPPLVRLSAAIGIQPTEGVAAGNGRAFKPGDRVQIPFLVKDANPAAGSVAIYLQTAPDKWQELSRGQPLDQVYRFEIPAIATKEARIKVTAADQAGNVGEAVSAETFEIQTGIVIVPGAPGNIDEGTK